MEIDLELPSSRGRRLSTELEINDDDGGGDVVDNETMGGGDGVNLNVFNNNRTRVESYMPQNGLEFENKEAAYSFYRNYAWTVGFGITIKSSRRSKKSGKFIDIKIACSKFGSSRQSTITTSQSSCTKTECKATMHIKKRQEGKWFIFNFVEEHNHELFPQEFYNTIRGRKNQEDNAVGQKKGLKLVLDERDVELLLDYFTHMQADSPGFYHVIDFDSGARMRNVFWVEPKGRRDYAHFSDVVFFDTHYMRNKYRIPFLPIIGVNNHFQFILLGCALIEDETKSTFTWLMRTWLRAVASHYPKVVITDNIKSITEATRDVFPNASHCFCPWHVFAEVGPNLSHKFNDFQPFLMKLKKCTLRPCTREEFEKKWHKMLKQFHLTDDKWMQSLFEDRCKWIPSYMREVFLGGFCTVERSQSIVSFFDKYLQKGTTFGEFIDRYKLFLHEWCEEEVKACVETRSSGLTLVSHSPLEMQMSELYTNAIFKKFQSEVSGMLSFSLEKESEDDETIIYSILDLDRKQRFRLYWNEGKHGIYCSCHLFEYSGFLCRHALSVLQLSGISTIPPNYVLKRWTRTAKIMDITHPACVNTNFRVQRLNDICKLAIKLGTEGSLSEEAYKVAYYALEKAMDHCTCSNYSVKSIIDTTKTNVSKVQQKRKVQARLETLSNGIEESSQDVEQPNQRSHRLHNSYISQQDCYYDDQPLMQGIPGSFSTRASHQASQLNPLQGEPSSLDGCSQVRDGLNEWMV